MSLVQSRHFGAFILAATFLLLLMAYYQMQHDTSGYKQRSIKTVNLEELIGSNENNLFFIETNDNISAVHPRLLCAFESAAEHNPTLKVQIHIRVFLACNSVGFEDCCFADTIFPWLSAWLA